MIARHLAKTLKAAARDYAVVTATGHGYKAWSTALHGSRQVHPSEAPAAWLAIYFLMSGAT